MTAGFKAVSTDMCYQGTDEMRQACGGAGYHQASGLVLGFADSAPMTTYEGVNVLMAQQSSRFILKQMKKLNQGKKLHGIFEYLNHVDELANLKFEGAWTLEKISEALRARAAYHI